MIPAGYMAKRVAPRPDWLEATGVHDIYSVSGCISKVFADYINDWRHNGFWLFDSVSIIEDLARKHDIDMSEMTMFYYEAYETQYDAELAQWRHYKADRDFPVRVESPEKSNLQGFDVVTFSMQTTAECSPLSCNGLAAEIATNQHCLLDSLENTIRLIEEGKFNNSEPGPFRVFSVYTV